METTRVLILLAMASVTAVAGGCSKQETGASSAPRTSSAAANPASGSPAPAAPAPAPTARTACAMVTAAEMSTILGTTVAAEGEGLTCRYKPAGQSMSSVELVVAWGDGEVALASSRMLGRIEPGIANKMAGLGDEATAIGPALWVRTGEDLVTLTFFGVDDHVAVAKRIISVMRPRMGPSAQPRAKAGGSAGAAIAPR